jgi:hypothetical protein
MHQDRDKFLQDVAEGYQVWKGKAGDKMSQLDNNIKAVSNENKSKIDRLNRNW